MNVAALSATATIAFAFLAIAASPPACAAEFPDLSDLKSARELFTSDDEKEVASESNADARDSAGAGDTDTVPEPAVENADTAKLAQQNCIQAGDEDEAATIALLFGDGQGEKGLARDDVSEYLVGLCVPDEFEARFELNQFLLAKGSNYSFYAERSLEALARYLEEAGVELGIKVEALRKDGKLRRQFRQENDIEQAGVILNQDHTWSDNAELFVPAIASLREEQRAEALVIASRARGHAINATYFLSRGLYVSKQMSGQMADNVGEEALALRSDLNDATDRANPLATIGKLSRRLPFGRKEDGREASATVRFAKFAADNGNALVGTLTSVTNVVASFDTDAAEIPQLSQDELDADVERLNDEWSLPAEFEDEEAYAANNTLAD